MQRFADTVRSTVQLMVRTGFGGEDMEWRGIRHTLRGLFRAEIRVAEAQAVEIRDPGRLTDLEVRNAPAQTKVVGFALA